MEGYKEFVDLGRTVEVSSPQSKSAKKAKTEKSYSRIDLDAADFPYLAKKKIGEKCTVVVELEKSGDNQPESWESTKGRRVTVKLLSLAEPSTGKDKDDGKKTARDIGY